MTASPGHTPSDVLQVADAIRHFIVRRYLPGESASNLLDDTPLRSTGILDSLATLGLVTFLEEQYQIRVDAYETDIDNFDRIRDIAVFVARKRACLQPRHDHA